MREIVGVIEHISVKNKGIAIKTGSGPPEWHNYPENSKVDMSQFQRGERWAFELEMVEAGQKPKIKGERNLGQAMPEQSLPIEPTADTADVDPTYKGPLKPQNARVAIGKEIMRDCKNAVYEIYGDEDGTVHESAMDGVIRSINTMFIFVTRSM